ncbi:CRISPR-associated endonuclease Cas2 [Oceanospirillum beijerinckii]|uniref:CRISPR-associated endonuclease Cas2 n=1 Tax=Oceanospirillum beijerinckii TaxID=64976 RepID=UPI00040B556F|nr:CRISPR-associated endonuclease Cas2 [Oceanospirillum beijerinckii]
MPLTYLVCFDIENDKIRRKLGNALLACGRRVQYSVFEIRVLTDSQLAELKSKLTEIMEASENPDDDIRFYYLNSTTLARSSTLENEPVGHFPSATIL